MEINASFSGSNIVDILEISQKWKSVHSGVVGVKRAVRPRFPIFIWVVQDCDLRLHRSLPFPTCPSAPLLLYKANEKLAFICVCSIRIQKQRR